MKLSLVLPSLSILIAVFSNLSFADASNCHRVCFPSGNERGRICRTVCETVPQSIQFSCSGTNPEASVSIRGSFQLGQYYRMGHSAVRSGHIESSSTQNGEAPEKLEISIYSGDYQDSGHAILRGFSAQSAVEMRVDGDSSSITFAGNAQTPLNCSMED